jgi:hydroxypyruvate isomerase
MSTGFDDPANHPMLLAEFEAAIPLAARAGVPNLIAVFGNRHDAAPADAMASCVAGLSQIAPLAEKHGVTICCEGDGTAFGFDVIQMVCSLRVKLLYKIYRMQINDIPWIAHFLTGGVDELDYGALALAIADSGFPGYVAHELPRAGDPYNALAHAYRMFDV